MRLSQDGVVVLLLCLTSVVVGNVTSETPFVVGTAGYGYTLALKDNNGGLVLATSPSTDAGAFVMKKAGIAGGAADHEVELMAERGAITCGCIATVNDKQYLFAGLSSIGYAVRVDLSFNTPPVYLNATNEALLWSGHQPLTLTSAVCKDQYVYFGTKSAGVSNTILRLDTLETDTSARFRSLGPITTGDLTQASNYGDAVVFAAEPDGDLPLTFFTINTGSDWSLKNTFPTTDVPNFELLSSITADSGSKSVVVANANSEGRVAVIDLSVPGAASVLQTVSLDTQGISPITSFVVDTDARFAYATVGTCSDESDTAVVAVRLVPTLTQMEMEVSSAEVYNCTASGVPATSLIWPDGADRRLLVATQIESSEAKRDGAIVPYSVHTSADCPSDCGEGDGHGECAGGLCYCYAAWDGSDCSTALPCGGTDCSGNGNCTIEGVCDCNVGYSGDDCSILVPCPRACSNHGQCNQSVCVCDAGFTGLGCELVSAGCASLGDCNEHGTCEEGHPVGTCVCNEGWTGADCATRDMTCMNNCNGRGECINGTCECETGWVGADCGIVATHCPNNCSGHGICSSKRCFCFHGYKGLDCGTVDRSFCFSGCQGHGSCVNGLCVCEPGWKGTQCDVQEADLRVANEVILVAGENKATSSFVLSKNSQEVVFCVASTPGKCISFDPSTMSRLREGTFDQVNQAEEETTMLLEAGEGRAPIAKEVANSLVPNLALLSSVSMVEVGTGVSIGNAPISVALVEDTVNGFAILGTRLNGNGTMHGQLLKVNLESFARVNELEFDDDSGRGVTAGCKGSNSTFFFASGSDSSSIYRVSPELEILSRVPATQTPPNEVGLLLCTKNLLLAASGNVVYLYDVFPGVLEPHFGNSEFEIDQSLGDITSGFVEVVGDDVIAYLGTSSSPGALVKLTIAPTGVSVEALRLRSGENRVSSITRHGDFAYLGLGSDGSSCYVAKVVVSAFREVDAVDVKGCAGDLISGTVSSDGTFAYFGNGASPAHVYTIRLFARTACPSNCSAHGQCVQGTCSCNSGWMGDACQTVVPSCPNNCSHAGTCLNGTCQCNLNHFGDDCSVIEICSEKCQNGHCDGANNTWPCVCNDESWEGLYCSQIKPYCPNECSNHGSCQSGVCVCDLGFEGADCSVEAYPPVTGRSCVSDSDCGTHGVCIPGSTSGSGTCECAEGWTGADCDVDSELRDAVETSKVSPILIGLLVAVALIIGMVAGVSIWKSWANNAGGGGATTASRVGGGGGAGTSAGYNRLPRRLVK